MLFFTPLNLYERLEVPENALPTEIEAAFRRLVKELHPTTNHTAGEDHRFVAVVVAYEILVHEDRRLDYDRFLAKSRVGEGADASSLYVFLGKHFDSGWWIWPHQEYEGLVRRATTRAGYSLEDFPFQSEGWIKRYHLALYEQELSMLQTSLEQALTSARIGHESALNSLRITHDSDQNGLRITHDSDQNGLRITHEGKQSSIQFDSRLSEAEKQAKQKEVRRTFEHDRKRLEQKFDRAKSERATRYRLDLDRQNSQYALEVARAEKDFDRQVQHLRERFDIKRSEVSPSVTGPGRILLYAGLAAVGGILLLTLLILLFA